MVIFFWKYPWSLNHLIIFNFHITLNAIVIKNLFAGNTLTRLICIPLFLVCVGKHAEYYFFFMQQKFKLLLKRGISKLAQPLDLHSFIFRFCMKVFNGTSFLLSSITIVPKNKYDCSTTFFHIFWRGYRMIPWNEQMGQGIQEWNKYNLRKTAFKKFEVMWPA